MTDERRKTPLSQHVISILVILIAGGVTWIAFSIVDLKTRISALPGIFVTRDELREQLNEIKNKIEKVSDKVDRVSDEQQRRTAAFKKLMKEDR
jgi:predicted PurR-regulated permease PerM